jgi:tryptophan synthase alpha chain
MKNMKNTGNVRIHNQLEKIKQSGKMGLMTHVVVGYPSLEKTEELVLAMVEEGVDMIELQIPFSDPVADGPTILKASQEALDTGTTVEDAFDLVESLRNKRVEIPLLFMTYANVVYSQGVENFMEISSSVGVDGYILPDFPFDTEEGQQAFEISQKKNQEMIPLYAPTMSDERFAFISQYAQNILYAVSRTGVTGVKGFSADLDEYLKKIKNHTSASIALGFGIQSAEQVHSLQGKAELAVIGSHILSIFQNEGVEAVRTFLREIKQ